MKITVNGREYDVPKGITVADALALCSREIPMPCGGRHTCGKCVVTAFGELSEMSDEEKRLIGSGKDNKRLACMTTVLGEAVIVTKTEQIDIITEGRSDEYHGEHMDGEYGFAVDIGTTTVVVGLYRMADGKKLGERSFLNPQSSFGADVISRISVSLAGDGGKLSDAIGNALADAMTSLCREASLEREDILSAVITGNTAMLYFLAGRPASELSSAPFEIKDRMDRTVSAEECSIGGFPRMRVYLPPVCAAFVGADITTALVSAHTELSGCGIGMLIDIGTNGELVLSANGKLTCCSTAAGPAFEGVGISCGMMASCGAIDTVYRENGKICYSVIGNADAVGICGSGLIDAISAMIDCGYIDETGAIESEDNDSAVAVGDSGISLTLRDIRAFQLAKSAIAAGIFALAAESGIDVSEIDRLVIAGGFGSRINIKNAVNIGLIPKELEAKTIAVGNAAMSGAVSMLLHSDAVEAGRRIAGETNNIELSLSRHFSERYIDCMMLGEV